MGSSPEKHHVVVLEACYCKIPEFDFPYTYTEYWNTNSSEVTERIRGASILIITIVPVTPADLEKAPHIKLIAVMATGIDCVDREYCAEKGISVVHCPQSNIPAVSEHAIGLYFAARRKTTEMHNRTTKTDEWHEKGTLTESMGPPPLSCGQEVMGIIGYGSLGKRVEMLARAVGFEDVIIAERKGAKTRWARVAFQEVLKRATAVVVCCPRSPETINLIGEPELQLMRTEALLVNVARGGVVNEAALAKALREGRIACAATDVLEIEPGVRGTPLLPKDGDESVPNLTISPHIAWYAAQTIVTLQRLLKEGVESWVAGKPIYVAVHDRKIYQ